MLNLLRIIIYILSKVSDAQVGIGDGLSVSECNGLHEASAARFLNLAPRNREDSYAIFYLDNHYTRHLKESGLSLKITISF
jgi:hypothetical protein